jgi:hypothetical protein
LIEAAAGDISTNGISGDFSVLKDGSGSISSHDAGGEVTVP